MHNIKKQINFSINLEKIFNYALHLVQCHAYEFVTYDL